MKPPAPAAKPKPKPAPKRRPQKPVAGVELDDHVFVEHPEKGALAVRVLSAGADGFMGECKEGGQHGCLWDSYRGHKSRQLKQYTVADQGADGALLQDESGRRRFVAGALAAPEAGPKPLPGQARPEPTDDPLTGGLDKLRKALQLAPFPQEDAPVPLPENATILLLKAGTIANRAGLALQNKTDKGGHQTRRWVRTNKEQPKGRQAARPDAPAAPHGAPMAHGDTVAFRHGDVGGEGKVVGSGADGVTLEDKEGQRHKVRHEHLVKPEGAGGGDGRIGRNTAPNQELPPDQRKAKQDSYNAAQEAKGQPGFEDAPDFEARARERDAAGAGGQAPAYPDRNAGEEDKPYLKRIKGQLPDPEHLPEEHGRYFNMEGSKTVPMDQLVSTKSDEENQQGGNNSPKFMRAAYDGKVAKRDPISVRKREDGKYEVTDGNGTLTGVKKHGWKALPVKVEGEGGDAKETGGNEPAPLFDPKEVEGLPKDAVQPVKDEAALYEASAPALDHLKEWLNLGKGLCDQLGFETMKGSPEDADMTKPGGMLFIAPVKGRKRAAEKVASDYGGDWSKLCDPVRCSIAVDSMDQIDAVVSALKKGGLKLARQPKDRFSKPTSSGYRDLMMNVVLPPNGLVGEVQVHLKSMLVAKAEGHHYYEIERKLEPKAKAGTLTPEETAEASAAIKKQIEIYGSAWQKTTAGAAGGAAADAGQMTKAMAMADGEFEHLERDGAYFRRRKGRATRGVDDVLHGDKWVPYAGDALKAGVEGDLCDDPLGGGEKAAGGDMSKGMFLFFKRR